MTRLYKYGDNSIFLYSQRSFSPQALHFSGAEDQQNYPYFNIFRSFFSFLPNNLYMSFKVLNTMTTERLSDRTEYCDKRVSAGWDAEPPVSSEGFLPCIQSVQSLLCPTLCDPIDCSKPGLPVHHQLPELAQTHVNRVGDAIQQSHPLSSPSPGFNLSQHQGLF